MEVLQVLGFIVVFIFAVWAFAPVKMDKVSPPPAETGNVTSHEILVSCK